MDDIDKQLELANQRLKAARMGLVIWRRGSKLSLRGMLPPKPHSGKVTASQQTLSLDIYANPAGIKRAEAEARKIAGLVACREFDWLDYIDSDRHSATVADWITKFERDYFNRRSRSPKSETTWRTEYRAVFRSLPLEAELTTGLLLAAVTRTEPDSRNRQRYCMVAGQLAKFAGLDFDPAPLAGSYSPQKVVPRDLPTDEEIVKWRDRIPNDHGWQTVFSLMACYGLRNHEVFNLDMGSLSQSPGILTVLDGKTGGRRVWPCYPEWWEKWQLGDAQLPEVTGRDNSALGGRVTQALKRYGFRKPYNLRHAWAVRTLEFGLPIELAAQQMGHSLSVHSQVYHHWISDRHHQRAFDLLMQRADRPQAP